eukprot:TRINITY_DN3772_c0_g1_i2.p1 TRINITY_DN3772_c0_g1~~TRINITY_DN3772_c0_g1_i2.p1  ORF type:complete len:322 (-),score=61.64 TRINITY_DN3772_c0_g1_i2:468-1433(-)
MDLNEKRNILLKEIELKRLNIQSLAKQKGIKLDKDTLKPINLSPLVPIYQKAKQSESQSYTTTAIVSKKQENAVPLKLNVVKDIGCEIFPAKEGAKPRVNKVYIRVEMKSKIDGEKQKMIDKKLSCKVCHKEHSRILLPYFCGNCKNNVCCLCSTANFSSEVLKISPMRICNSCVPSIKKKLKEKSKDKKHADYAKIELSALPFGNCEFFPLGTIKKLDLNFDQEKACRLCYSQFGFFRASKKCGKCRNLSCASCVKVVTSPELGILEPTPLCRECVLKTRSMRLRSSSQGSFILPKVKKRKGSLHHLFCFLFSFQKKEKM